MTPLLLAAAFLAQPAKIDWPADAKYEKRPTRGETVSATLKAFALPTFDANWKIIGPFPFDPETGFDADLPAEKTVDFKLKYKGLDGAEVAWKSAPDFKLGKVLNVDRLLGMKNRSNITALLAHEFESPVAMRVPLFLGSDDTISVYFNGRRVVHENTTRPATPDSDTTTLDVKAGKNLLVVKVGQYGGEWQVYVCPGLPDVLPAMVTKQLDRDYPALSETRSATAAAGAEAKYYKVTTLPQPADCVLEVGGLAFKPDGTLLACTRRGEIWQVTNPAADSPGEVRFTRYAAGLHEALGLYVQDDKTVFVVQRPELSKLTDSKGTGVADGFETVCDKWGVSGDYHEFAFGPARDKAGNFFITLNVGFGGGHQAKSPWRGWCVKVSPDGAMEPWAYGLRSPNGINFSPDGDLFYCDNQGEWVATNKMHHLKQGKFYGHQAPLQWVKHSPFAGKVSDKVKSGMYYDGQKGGYPEVDPPCIWFPYGRMGQSVSEPVWDTTGGKFGPFAGQCFVGDQTRSIVMRVALEKTNGVYQGACFPFRAGLQCGVNRIVFGPDGSMYVGQTNRGWGSTGGKPYGLQRIAYSGELPFEIKTMTVTPTGFDLTFTKPVDPKTSKADAASMKSWTYAYLSQYGCPETDTQAEPITASKLSGDGLKLSLTVPGRKKGRVYELRLNGVKTAAGEEVLHPEAYYTLNEVPK